MSNGQKTALRLNKYYTQWYRGQIAAIGINPNTFESIIAEGINKVHMSKDIANLDFNLYYASTHTHVTS